MKSKWIWIIGLLLLVLAGAGWWGYRYYLGLKRPFEKGTPEAEKIRIKRVVATESYFDGPKLLMKGVITLTNPLPGEGVIEMKQAHLVGHLENRVEVPIVLDTMGDRQHLHFSARVPADDYIKLVRKLQRQDSISIAVTGKLPLQLPVIGAYDVPLDGIKFKLATLKLPLATLGHVHLTERGLSHAKAELPVYVQNQEKADLRVRDMTLKVTIDEVGEFEATQAAPMELKGKGKDTVLLKGELDLKNPFKTLVSVLRNKDKYPARIVGHIKLRIVSPKGTEVAVPINYDEVKDVELVPKKETINKVKEVVEGRKRKN